MLATVVALSRLRSRRLWLRGCVLLTAVSFTSVVGRAQSTLPDYLRLVAQYNAPFLLNEAQPTSPGDYDQIIPVDWDGDEYAANNIDAGRPNVDRTPTVYFSIAESGIANDPSAGFYFVGYYWYHNRDGGFSIYVDGVHISDAGHPSDMEGAFFIVKKSPYFPYGYPILALSEAHGALIPYWLDGAVDPN